MNIILFVFLAIIIFNIAKVAKHFNVRKSHSDKVFAGVCGGIAKRTGINSTTVRAIFVILTVIFGGGILTYILLAVILPD